MISGEMIGVFVTGAGIIGHVFVANFRINKNENEIDKVWNWKNSYEDDAHNRREKIQEQIAEIRGSQMVVSEQFRQIMGILTEIKNRIADLENNKNGRN